MSKKYTAKEMRQILLGIIGGAIEHMESIKAEIKKIGPVTDETDPNMLARAKVMHLTLTAINDIIHPSHSFCYQAFPDNKEYFDFLVRQHRVVVEKKMVPPCYCPICEKIRKESVDAVKEDNGEQKVSAN